MPDTIASLLALEIPNFLPESPGFLRPAGRLIWCSFVLGIGIAVAFIWARQPKKSAEPATWAATILGARRRVCVHDARVRRLAARVAHVRELVPQLGQGHLRRHPRTSSASNLPPIDVPRYVLADIVAAGSYFVFGTINVYAVLGVAEAQGRRAGQRSAKTASAVEQLPAGRVLAGCVRQRASGTSALRPPRHDERASA